MTTKHSLSSLCKGARRYPYRLLVCLLLFVMLFNLIAQQDVRGVWQETESEHQISFNDQGDCYFNGYHFQYAQQGNRLSFWKAQQESAPMTAWFFRWGHRLYLELDIDSIGGEFYDQIGWAALERCYP